MGPVVATFRLSDTDFSWWVYFPPAFSESTSGTRKPLEANLFYNPLPYLRKRPNGTPARPTRTPRSMTPDTKREHDAEASWSSWLASYAGSAMFEPTRLLGRGLMRLGSCPLDETVGIAAAVSSPSELSPTYEGKRVMVVGGTRGIGRAIASTLREAGAHVTVVGRSAVPFTHVSKASSDCEAFAADLSTTVGCRKLVSEVVASGVQPFHFLVFTVGAW